MQSDAAILRMRSPGRHPRAPGAPRARGAGKYRRAPTAYTVAVAAERLGAVSAGSASAKLSLRAIFQ